MTQYETIAISMAQPASKARCVGILENSGFPLWQAVSDVEAVASGYKIDRFVDYLLGEREKPQ